MTRARLPWLLLIAMSASSAAVEAPSNLTGAPAGGLRVPEGFVVERVAAWPLVEHPMMAGFDERGRLFVAESAGFNLKADQLLKDLPNRVRLLEDTDGDGRFDKSTIFADRMTMPQGALWYRGALYTGSPPSLWRLEDTDGDGVADRRQELATGFQFTGNAADIHGPSLGPDGRLYWAHGRKGHSIPRADGSPLNGLAAGIYRSRPDGTELELVCGGGMDNPVEVAFTSEGEPLATVNIFLNRPSRLDAIIYCIEGGVYPWMEKAYQEFKQTGDLLPPVGPLGWVAPAGLMRYCSDALGTDYRDNLFSAQFNTRRIQRHPIERAGAAFQLKNEDFLVAESPDFHPTDVLEDADGSLLVVDTGGWFRIGCPTSQIAKPEIKGAIYRVRRKDAVPPADPRGLQLAWGKLPAAELVGLLDDSRPAVRDRAIDQLALRGAAALSALHAALLSSSSVRTRRNAVWALTRQESPAAQAVLCQALQDAELSVRLAAAHAVGLHRVPAAIPVLQQMASDDQPAARRAAAAALGRIKPVAAVPTLLAGLRSDNDRFLDHALIYALLEIADAPATRRGLSDPSPHVRRGALVALNQMEGGRLTRDEVIGLLNTSDAALQKAALAIAITHPEWAGAVAGLLEQWAARADLDDSRREGLRDAVLAFAAVPAVQELVAKALRQEDAPIATRLVLAEAMSRTSLKELPPVWIAALRQCLMGRNDSVVREAIGTVRAVGNKEFDGALRELGSDPARPAEVRLAAWGAVAARVEKIRRDEFLFLLAQLHKDQPPLVRRAAAEALGHLRLDDDQLLELTSPLAESGPFELPLLVAAFERSRTPAVATRLLAALETAPGFSSLSADGLRRTMAGYPEEIRSAAMPLLKRLEVDRDQQQAKLAELEPLLKAGEARLGRTVFFGARAACSACHLVNGEGGRMGPDLSKIATIRSGRDLLEALVFPSASFVRSYEPYVVVTQDGRPYLGTLARETVDAVFLYTAEGKEIRLARDQIDEIQPGRVSIMPQGLDIQLPREQLADLLAFLQSLR